MNALLLLDTVFGLTSGHGYSIALFALEKYAEAKRVFQSGQEAAAIPAHIALTKQIQTWIRKCNVELACT